MWYSLIYFAGGIGLFLYGMKLMSDGLALRAGSKLKRILEVLTRNKFLGVFVGFLITAMIQSSTATNVMIVGFVNAGLLKLSQAVGIVIGANVGTTTTGLILALNIHTIAPICIFIGAVLMLFTKNKKTKHLGMIFAGFGLLFLGLRIMSDAMRPLAEEPWMVEIFRFAENPFFGILLGFFITAILHSSTASLGILFAAMTAGVITDLNQAIFILYGQNLGNCLTPIVSSFGLSKNAQKTSLIHLVYNTIGITIIVIITLLPLGFVDFIKSLSSNVSQQLVYTHIIINVLMAIMLLPLSGLILKIVNTIIKEKEVPASDYDFEYIEERLLEDPSFAVVQTYKEIERLASIVSDNQNLVKKVVVNQSKSLEKDIKTIHNNEHIINLLSGKIQKFIVKLNSSDLEGDDIKLIASLSRVVIDLEKVANHYVNIVKSYEFLLKDKQSFSTPAIKDLNSMFTNVNESLDKAIEIFKSGKFNKNKINEVKELEMLVDEQNEEFKNNHIERSREGICNLKAGIAFIKIITDLERISDYACNVAYSVKK